MSTVAPAWPAGLQEWLAYAVVTGHSNELVLAQLSSQGLVLEGIDRYLDELRASPLATIGAQFAGQLAQLQWALDLQSSVRQQNPYDPIPVIPASEIERFRRDFLFANRPVRVQGLTEDWPAQQWTFETLRSRWGQHSIEYTEHAVTSDATESLKRDGTLAEFIDRIGLPESQGRFYWTAYNQDGRSAELMADMTRDVRGLPGLYSTEAERSAYFWVGPSGTRSGLHFDPYNVLFVQLHGHKRFYLLPPSFISSLYLFNDYFSPVDLENPQPHLHPKAQGLQPITLDLGPGEALLIPVGWFHQVTSLSASISVSLTGLELPGGNSYSPPSAFQGQL